MSNTIASSNQWKEIAEHLGYDSETLMWHQLYTIEGRTIDQLAKTLGFSTCCISRRIGLCGISKRLRGGANNPSRILATLAHLDQRFVRTSGPKELAEVIGCSPHSIYRSLQEV